MTRLRPSEETKRRFAFNRPYQLLAVFSKSICFTRTSFSIRNAYHASSTVESSSMRETGFDNTQTRLSPGKYGM